MGISTKLGKVAVLASNARTGCTSVSGDADLHTWCVANCAAGLCPAGTCTCADGQDHDHAHSPPTLASSVGLASSPQAELTCRALVPTATDSWCEANCGGGHPCPPAVCSCGPQADADANTALSKFQTSPPNDAEDGAIASDANASQSAKVPNAEDVPCEGPVCAPSATDMSDPNYNATAEAAPKKDLTFRLEMLGRYARQKSKESTETTIAIGFLTRDTLPLFDKVWSSFFEGCNGRAAVPIVHMQADPESEDGAAVRHDMAKRIEPYGGAIVPHEKTVYGEMRFSFNMVSGMFALARTAAKHRAPNGRLPDWIHFASERCAPIRPCPALQRFLDDSQGVNHLESSPATSVGVQMVAQTNVPEEFQPLTMSSQWATLWLPDVMQLTEIEDELREKWGPRSHPAPIYGIQVSESVFVYGAPDEWLWHTELSRLNKTLQSPGLTNVYWCWGCEHADNMDGASPAAFLDHDKAVEGCTRAQNMGDFFGRKFGNGDPEGMEGVAKGLLECKTQKVEVPGKHLALSRAKLFPRTRGAAMAQHGQAVMWTNSSKARGPRGRKGSVHMHMERYGEGKEEETLDNSPKAQALRMSEGEARLSRDFRSGPKAREARGNAIKITMPR